MRCVAAVGHKFRDGLKIFMRVHSFGDLEGVFPSATKNRSRKRGSTP